ncbi:MAG: hypothetical protein HY851_04180 [candidate division Zixibacteria bacterium]|nr:hypothetical protein [candidate division Zixibacteria bacterium]
MTVKRTTVASGVVLVFAGLFVAACQNRSTPIPAAADAGAGSSPAAEFAMVGFMGPSGTTSNWSPALPFVIAAFGMPLSVTPRYESAVASMTSVQDISTGENLPIETDVSTDYRGEWYEVMPVGGLKAGNGYRLSLTPDPSKPLARVFSLADETEFSSGSFQMDVYTYSKPTISFAGLYPKKGEEGGNSVVMLDMSEYFRVEDLTSGPKPAVLIDDVEVSACVMPDEFCDESRPQSEGFAKLPIGEEGADVDVTFYLSYYLSENFFGRIQKISVRIPKNARGISATFEEGAQNIPMASVVGDFVEYTFYVRDAKSVKGEAYSWRF